MMFGVILISRSPARVMNDGRYGTEGMIGGWKLSGMLPPNRSGSRR